MRKTLELEASVAKANAEKQALLEQKEIVVQQLQRENEVLEVSASQHYPTTRSVFSIVAVYTVLSCTYCERWPLLMTCY